MTDPIPPTIEWRDGVVRLIDQRRLPAELVFIDCRTVGELCEAIASLAVRGAPALGAAGAMGMALAARNREPLDAAAARLRATRPTAVNLAWGSGAQPGERSDQKHCLNPSVGCTACCCRRPARAAAPGAGRPASRAPPRSAGRPRCPCRPASTPAARSSPTRA